jgi:hypothetical protein
LLEAHEDARARLSVERAHTLMRWTRLDERLANALDALYALLAETMVNPDHPCGARSTRLCTSWRTT